ncbi:MULTISPECIES: hypothetical protein [unclassified Micromonospora]|uniref:hypothetical protein n=1 Tax=unclassified Micromonospora TaxID=2617518 RepID=UPI003627A06E
MDESPRGPAGEHATPARERPPAAREHLPARPIWLCRACGGPWPCSPARRRLLHEYADAPVTLAVHLAGLMLEAGEQLNRAYPYTAPSPEALHRRFLGWLRGRGAC